MDEVKYNPVAKRFIEIAGKQRIDELTRRTLARASIKYALRLDLAVPDDAEALLASYADEDALFEMVVDMASMTDFMVFLKVHGVDIPGFGG
jgi:hypothetical protein